MIDTDLSNLRIIIDEREKKSGIPDLLQSVGIPTEIKMLPLGDYIVRPEIVVERKSIRDFMSSIFDGRLFDQCDRLCEHYRHPIIIIEGNIDEIDDITENSMVFYGALSSVALDFKIPVLPTASAQDTAKLLVTLGVKKGHTRGPFIKKIKKYKDPHRQQLSLLASLPGVGDKLAVRLLERYGTPGKALAATASDLAKISGMTLPRARSIRSMLDSPSKHHKESNQTTLQDS